MLAMAQVNGQLDEVLRSVSRSILSPRRLRNVRPENCPKAQLLACAFIRDDACSIICMAPRLRKGSAKAPVHENTIMSKRLIAAPAAEGSVAAAGAD